MSSIIFTAICLVFVIGVLSVVAYAIYECTPLPHRANPYRDPVSGERRWESPRVGRCYHAPRA